MRSAADAAPSFVYLPGLARLGERFTLAGEDARYVSRVVRAREGEHITASDGEGHLAVLELEAVRPEVVVRRRSLERVPAPEPRCLFCGAPEGERGDWLVEKLAELGVTEFVPVDCDRARWPERGRHERWERLTVAALRQSRAAWRMRIAEPQDLRAAIPEGHTGVRWLASPEAAFSAGSVELSGAAEGAVGPSPGFSDEERKWLAMRGFVPVRLAAQRLRTETAAVALASVWAAHR